MSACATESLMVTLNPRVLRVAAPTLHPMINPCRNRFRRGGISFPVQKGKRFSGFGRTEVRALLLKQILTV